MSSTETKVDIVRRKTFQCVCGVMVTRPEGTDEVRCPMCGERGVLVNIKDDNWFTRLELARSELAQKRAVDMYNLQNIRSQAPVTPIKRSNEWQDGYRRGLYVGFMDASLIAGGIVALILFIIFLTS